MISACWSVLLFFVATFIHLVSFADENSDPVIVINPAWESKYVSEGQNNLDSGGIFSFDIAAAWQHLYVGSWFAQGDSESYQELNLYVGYVYQFHAVETYLNFTHLRFPKDNEHDNEIAFGLAYLGMENLYPAVDYTWSSEADGAFVEVSLNSQLHIENAPIVFTPYILQAFDFGYVTSDYDGPNNLQIGIVTTIGIKEHSQLNIELNHSWAQENLDREDLGDVTWVGIRLIWDM